MCQDYLIVWQAKHHYVGGTSLSAPLAANILNRVDEARLAAGKPPVTFINPALYAARP